MKIRNINSLERGINSIYGTETRDGPIDKANAFARTITSLSDEKHQLHMQTLAKDIDAQGQKVADRADIKEFEKYRAMIREFMDEVVSHGVSFSRENSYEARGRHRYTATIRVVNEKLDALARDLLEEHAESIDILQKMGEIHGLILDMML